MNTTPSTSPVRFMMLSAALCGVAMSSACNKPSSQAVAQIAIEWKDLREQTVCEGNETSRCIGYYGFSVTRDGHYQVGPAKNGKKLTGSLSSDESRSIQKSVNALITKLSDIPTECDDIVTIPGLGVRVELTLTNGTTLRVYEIHQAKLCTMGDRELAKSIHSELNTLMKRYYPIPFP